MQLKNRRINATSGGYFFRVPKSIVELGLLKMEKGYRLTIKEEDEMDEQRADSSK